MNMSAKSYYTFTLYYTFFLLHITLSYSNTLSPPHAVTPPHLFKTCTTSISISRTIHTQACFPLSMSH